MNTTDAVEPWDGLDATRLMTLQEAGPDRFCNTLSGVRTDNHLYGGQVLAHAVLAASRSAPDRTIQSLHAYFLRYGAGQRQVGFHVDRVRDGRGFSMREVVAEQGGPPLFRMSCLLRAEQLPGLAHQLPMPDVPQPEDLPTLEEYARDTGDGNAIRAAERLRPINLIELKLANPISLAGGESRPRRQLWMRIPSAAGTDDPLIHTALLAYLSDFWLAGAALSVHPVTYAPDDPFTATLDHAMWFHRRGRVDDWVLHDLDSPSALNSTALARGLLFSRDGTLLASTAQEGLMRLGGVG